MQWTIRGMLAGALLAAASVAEAQQPPQQQPRPFPQQQQPQQPPRQVAVATVNGDVVTKKELEVHLQTELADLRKEAERQGQELAPQAVQKVRKQTLDTLIESRLIEQHVAQTGPDVKREEVEATLGRVKQQLAAQQVGFDQFLASRGYTEQSFRKRIEGSLGWQRYQQQQLNEENLRNFFEQNRDQFQAESFEQAQQQVIRAYTVAAWNDIVRRMKPKAEIKILAPGEAKQPPQGEASVPPGAFRR